MMTYNFFFILLGATITQGAFLVFALLTSKHSNKTANYLLSGLIVLFSYYALVKILSNTNEILHYPHLIRTYRPIFILACPVIYFYCKALTTPGFRFTYKDSLHLIPFGMYILIMLPFFFSDPATKVASLSLQPFTLSWMIERGFWVIIFFFYFGFSFRTIHHHQQHITDKYGGSVENRCRFLTEVYKNVRETVGADYPVLIKLNAADHVDGGLEINDAVYAAKKLSEAGIDAIEISTGTPASGEKGPVRSKINKPEREAYNLDLACKIKAGVDCPVMVVGGFRSYEVAQKAIKEDNMDYISMARPLIREPDLPNRWSKGDRSPARCISCNKCFMAGIEEGGIYCVVDKKEREKAAKR